VILALLLFLPAWSLHFWQAWIYWTLFSFAVLFLTLYFLKYDPALIERRMKAGPLAEQEKSQKIIQTIVVMLMCITFVIPGFDHRFHWSSVPTSAVMTADALVLVGFLIIFFVFKENSYAAGTVQVEAHQHVISTGPYRWVRHPMYVGAVFMFLATPVALGSFWALPPAFCLVGMIAIRLLEEEKYLTKNLCGYDAYRHKVRYRLIPYVW
jgi:protein-S-isoprenylcysteine O-methyltransferase Ste14